MHMVEAGVCGNGILAQESHREVCSVAYKDLAQATKATAGTNV